MINRSMFAALALLVCSVAVADVRPISDAERTAVEIASQYLAGGPSAIEVHLAASSPLRKPEMLEEIEARLGPNANAEWELVTVVDALKDKTAAFTVRYPSGLDDTVFFDLVREGDAYKIGNIRNLAMPSTRGEYYAAVIDTKPVEQKRDRSAPLAGIVAAVVALAGVFIAPMRRIAGRVAFAIAFLLGSGAIALTFRKTEPDAAAPIASKKETGLHQTRALRVALAAGGDGVAAALAGAPKLGSAGDVVRVWTAQWQFKQGKLDEVDRALRKFPLPSSTPLVEMLRARLALTANDPAGAIVAYQRAINLGPGRDSLWIEASSALFSGGFEKDAKAMLKRVASLGSREADVYYLLALLERESEKESEQCLKRAWALLPAERGSLLASGLLSSVVRKRGPMLVDLSDPREATFATPAVSSRPIVIPSGAMANVSGEFLHIATNDARLYVPGGASLAPLGTPTVDAGEWSRIEEERALRAVPALLANVPNSGSYMQPALRDRITASADALAKRNRWSEVVQLTEGVSPKSEFVPSKLFMLRATALQRANRQEDSKQLLMDVAASPVLVRKRDVYGLEQLADMLASQDLYSLAVKTFERAKTVGSEEYADVRITQVGMDERLARQYSTHKSAHFEIHYPSDVHPAQAMAISDVLEGELKRLQRWVPISDFQPVVVNIVWWQEFKSTYTGSDNILGFYNGKITLPLAGISELNPMVVSLITHELCHAMIAQASRNQAPRWFHEGLAQRVEMVDYSPNAFNMYEDQKLFAVSVLDPVLAGSRDPDMTGAAYVVAQTFVRYVESLVGEAGIRALSARFAAGDTTEAAIAAVTRRPLQIVDASFRTWGKAENRVFANTISVRYDTTPAEAELAKAVPEKKRERRRMEGGMLYPRKNGDQR